jgi:hypothetical protein
MMIVQDSLYIPRMHLVNSNFVLLFQLLNNLASPLILKLMITQHKLHQAHIKSKICEIIEKFEYVL